MSQEFAFVSRKCTPVNQVFHISCHLSLPPCRVTEITIDGSQCGCIHMGHMQEGLRRELQVTHIDISILNRHARTIYLRFIKSTNFYAVK